MHLFPSNQIEFLTSAPTFKLLPAYNGAEIAIVGRSNSGKSTFINHLCGQKIARTSAVPGKTQMINIFKIHPQYDYYLVDLPGYGFAKTPKSIKLTWQKEMSQYLIKRKNLKAVCITIDSRRTIGPLDQPILQWCQDNQLRCHVVLTKIDKLNQSNAKKAQMDTEKILNQTGHCFSLQTSSSIKKRGIDQARNLIGELFATFDLN